MTSRGMPWRASSASSLSPDSAVKSCSRVGADHGGRNARALLVDVGSRVEQGDGLQAVVGAGPGDGEPDAEVEADGPNPVAVEKDCSARSPKPKRPGVPRSMPAIKRAIHGAATPGAMVHGEGGVALAGEGTGDLPMFTFRLKTSWITTTPGNGPSSTSGRQIALQQVLLVPKRDGSAAWTRSLPSATLGGKAGLDPVLLATLVVVGVLVAHGRQLPDGPRRGVSVEVRAVGDDLRAPV